MGHTLSTSSNLSSSISTAAALITKNGTSNLSNKANQKCPVTVVNNVTPTISTLKINKKFANAEVSVNSLPEVKSVKLFANTTNTSNSSSATTLIQIPTIVSLTNPVSATKQTLNESLVNSLVNNSSGGVVPETSLLSNAAAIPVSSNIFYSNQHPNTEGTISVYSDHFLNHDTIISQSSTNNSATGDDGLSLISENNGVEPSFQLITRSNPGSSDVGSQDLVIVSLEKGVQIVQEQIKPRKDQLRQRFEQLLDQCFTDSDLKLIESSMVSVSDQLLPKP